MKRGINDSNQPSKAMALSSQDEQTDLNNQLYSFARRKTDYSIYVHTKLSPEELQKAEILLQQGADPNYIPKASTLPFGHRDISYEEITPEFYNDIISNIKKWSLVESAVNCHDPDFLRLLKKYGANLQLTGLPDAFRGWMSNEIQSNTVRKSAGILPLQQAIKNVLKNYSIPENHEICGILSETLPDINEYQEIVEQLKQLYIVLSSKLKQASLEAKQKNKRLLILIGEQHFQINSLCINAMMVFIAASQLNIKKVLEESDTYLLNQIKKTGQIFFMKKWCTLTSLVKYIEDIQGEIIPIDIASRGTVIKISDGKYKETEYDSKGYPKRREIGLSADTMRYRNNVMADVAHHSTKEDAICIVGSYHLYGLMKETNLQDNFHIFAINSSFDIDKTNHSQDNGYFKKCDDFTISSDIFQAGIGTPIHQSLLSPQKALDTVRMIHLGQQPNKHNNALNTTSPITAMYDSHKRTFPANDDQVCCVIKKTESNVCGIAKTLKTSQLYLKQQM